MLPSFTMLPLQSKSQSRLYQTKAVHESEAAGLIPAGPASTAGKAAKQQATAVSPLASPARRIPVKESPAEMVQAAAETMQQKSGEVRVACMRALKLRLCDTASVTVAMSPKGHSQAWCGSDAVLSREVLLMKVHTYHPCVSCARLQCQCNKVCCE